MDNIIDLCAWVFNLTNTNAVFIKLNVLRIKIIFIAGTFEIKQLFGPSIFKIKSISRNIESKLQSHDQ